MGKSARANCRRSVRSERREVVINSEKETKAFDAKQLALEKALNAGKAPIVDSRRKQLERDMINDDSSNALQEFDDQTYEKMKLHEKMYDEANAWGVSLGINKKILKVKGGGVGKEKKRSDFGEAVGVRAIFYRSETEKETEKSDEERGERREGESNDGIEVAYDLIRYRI